MKIGIDARMIGTKHRGIGRYVLELVKGLEKTNGQDLNFFYYSEDQKDYFGSLKAKQWPWRWYSLAEQIFLPIKIVKEGIDLMIWPHFNAPFFCPVKFWVVIHDLTIWHFPDSRATTLPTWLYWVKVYFSKLLMIHAALRAEKIIVPTEFVKQDVIKTLAIKPERIEVIYEGGELATLVDEIPELPPTITQQYFLYVGAAYPHKNLPFLLSAWSEFNQTKKYQLVLVGREDFFYQRLKQDCQDPTVLFFGQATDLQLKALYTSAQAFLFPSLYEGFGIPLLEAQTLNCPVISSNASCLPEILQESALWFNPNNKDSLVSALHEFINNQQLAENLKANGQLNSQKFSWQKFGQEWLQILDH